MPIRRPSHVRTSKEAYSDSEVGITHPFRPSYIRLADNGNVEIIGAEGMGIIFNAADRSVTIIADKVRFQTREDEGMLWNDKAFNPRATLYTQPTLIDLDSENIANIWGGVDDFLED